MRSALVLGALWGLASPGLAAPKARGYCTARVPAADVTLPATDAHYTLTTFGLPIGGFRVRAPGTAGRWRGEGQTSGFMSVLGTFRARMYSDVTPSGAPRRMRNRTVVKGQLVEERAAFVSGRVVGGLEDSTRRRVTKLRTTGDVVDILSIVPYVRTRAFAEDGAFCTGVLHRRRIWRAEGTAQSDTLRHAGVLRPVWRLDATVRPLAGAGHAARARPVQVWVAKDGAREVLQVASPDLLGAMRLTLDAPD